MYEVCSAIWEELQPTEMPVPTLDGYKHIAEDFQRLWNFPHCVGCIDGKHIRLQCPFSSGSTYYNYKQYFSLVLQGVADANAYFIAVDVGDYGRHSDSAVFKESSFGKAFYRNELPLPDPHPLDNSGPDVPYVFLADEAYPLKNNMMRPFPRRDLDNTKRIYNYRHSRARRTVECTFGLMTSKFTCLQGALKVSPKNAQIIVKACCILHNYIRRREGKLYDPQYINKDQETAQLNDIPTVNHRPSQEAMQVRNSYATYFLSESGKLPWQNDYAHVQ